MLRTYLPESKLCTTMEYSEAMTVVPLVVGRARGKIERVAVLYKGFVWSKAAPKRHHDIINEMFDILGGNIDSIQIDGFVSSSGHFVDRMEAMALVRASDQSLLEPLRGEELFSENLW